jgi:predicted ATPase
MDLGCQNNDAAIRLRVVFLPTSLDGRLDDGWPPRLEWRNLKEANSDWKELNKGDGHWFNEPRVQSIVSQFRSTNLLRLDATKLAEPSYSDNPQPRLDCDGAGMASVLALMALNQPDRFQSLQVYLQSVIPSVTRIRFDRVPVSRIETETVTIDSDRLTRRLKKEYIGDEILLDLHGAPDIPAHLASEGTLLVLGLLASLLGPVRPRLVLIDDLDHGLHPRAQRRIVPLLRKILDENQDLQIIATTHSPYIVDELDPKEVRITWAGEDGATECGRLDSHPDFERWKDEMWPGEFWSLVGEQWVANGQGREGR